MELIDLKVSARMGRGNGPARVLRREGSIPAVLYGPSVENTAVSVDTTEFETMLRISNSAQVLLNLVMDNGDTKQAMIKEMQRHPVTEKFVHIDFYAFDTKQKIKVKIPVIPTGQAAGVEEGGLLQLIRREIEVLCFPLEIPESIEVDVTKLNIGDSIHVDEISMPGNVEHTADVNYTVVAVLSPAAEEIAAEEDEEDEGEELEGEGEDAGEDEKQDG